MPPPGWEEEEEDEDAWMDEEDLGEDDESNDNKSDYFDEEDYSEYEDEDAEEDEEDELEALIDEGEALIEEGEYQQAIEIFREAAERFPECSTALYHVGQTALMLLSDGVESVSNWEEDDELVSYYEESLNTLELALTVDPEYYPALNGLGALNMVIDNVEAALEHWERSLDINSDQEEIVAALEEAAGQLD